MTMMALPLVNMCSVDGCSYNHDHDCHAGAITVMEDTAACGTFFTGEAKGGVEKTGMVGACHRTDCTHNVGLECGADRVDVGLNGDTADCLTFAAR
jgi:hypothetical protein